MVKELGIVLVVNEQVEFDDGSIRYGTASIECHSSSDFAESDCEVIPLETIERLCKLVDKEKTVANLRNYLREKGINSEGIEL